MTKRDLNSTNNFVEEMKRVCHQMGMAFSRPRISSLDNDRTETYLKCLRHDINKEVCR